MRISSEVLFTALKKDIRRYMNPESLEFLIQGGDMWPDITPTQAACFSIYNSLTKKLVDVVEPDADSKALTKFLACNKQCQEWSLQLDSTRDEILFNGVKTAIDDFWHPNGLPLVSSFQAILDEGRLGKGSSIKSFGESFYSKLFSSRLSCSSSKLYAQYKHYISHFAEWSNAEIIRSQNHGEPYVIESNSLSFVPKNDTISRVICTEPTLNGFFQLGLAEILNARLKDRFSIDLEEQQERNRRLAWIGSMTNRYATRDLSSASDTIGRNMLKLILPPDFFRLLDTYRCSSMRLPDGSKQEAYMMSTMGNGFTFPLQTIIFTCCVISAFNFRGIKPLKWRDGSGNFGVNGDDIVVPREIVSDVDRILSILGFTVNPEKSFDEGPFRESCGGDYFEGSDIRGVYIKRLDTEQDLYSVINQLNLFSSKTGVRLRNLVRTLLSRVTRRYVPFVEDDSSGIKVPFFLVSDSRFNKDLQAVEYRKMVPVPRYIEFTKRGKVKGPRWKIGRLIYNPSGLLISFLQGSICSGRYAFRHEHVEYREELGVTSAWDVIPTAHPLSGWIEWGQFSTATYFNIC